MQNVYFQDGCRECQLPAAFPGLRVRKTWLHFDRAHCGHTGARKATAWLRGLPPASSRESRKQRWRRTMVSRELLPDDSWLGPLPRDSG